MFLVNEIIFAIILTLFMITHVFHHGGECEQHHVIVEICLVAISALMMLYHLYIVLSQIRHGKTVSAEFLGMIKLSCPPLPRLGLELVPSDQTHCSPAQHSSSTLAVSIRSRQGCLASAVG